MSRCYVDGKQCTCKDANGCQRDPFRGPSFREEQDEEYQNIREMGYRLDDKDMDAR